MAPVLVTIRFSHFCDKARWALDRAGVAYDERAYLPGLHRFGVRAHGGRTTPLLVTPDGVLTESTDILRFADRHVAPGRRLYPDDAGERAGVDAFVAEMDAALGPATRLLAYHHLLPRPADLVRAVGKGMSFGERLLFRAAIPSLEGPMRRLMRIDDAGAARSAESIRGLLAGASARLSDGRRYLYGDRLGAADITFAALAAPAIMPPGHPSYAPDTALLPAPLRALVEEARATDAGRFVLRLDAEERQASGT